MNYASDSADLSENMHWKSDTLWWCHLLLNPSPTQSDEFSFTKAQDVVTNRTAHLFHTCNTLIEVQYEYHL